VEATFGALHLLALAAGLGGFLIRREATGTMLADALGEWVKTFGEVKHG